MRTEPVPRPDIAVTPAADQGSAPGSVDIVISRDGRGRSYRTAGGTNAEVVRDALKRVLEDPYSREWIGSEPVK